MTDTEDRGMSWFRTRCFEDEAHEEDGRTPYQHDRDRILHSTAFRRLQYKTQVYVIHEGDLYRTRLTHTLEVAQVAKGLALALKADPDLVEAIAFAHDLGHTPFGHAGETALRDLLRTYGLPFDHNVQSYRIVTKLEERYPAFAGLNLTHATLEGIMRHHTPFDREEEIWGNVPDFLKEEVGCYGEYPSPGLETQIVSMADLIAYAAHDIEDALSVGLLEWSHFKSMIKDYGVSFLVSIVDGELEDNLKSYASREPAAGESDPRRTKLRNRVLSRLIINRLMREAAGQSKSNMEALGLEPASPEIRAQGKPVVSLREEIQRQVNDLVNKLLFENVYREPRVMLMVRKATNILNMLFETFMEEPESLPHITQMRLGPGGAKAINKQDDADGKKLALVVGDYVAGMTDKYAMDMYQLLTQAYEKAL